jgi:hypothetical protein
MSISDEQCFGELKLSSFASGWTHELSFVTLLCGYVIPVYRLILTLNIPQLVEDIHTIGEIPIILVGTFQDSPDREVTSDEVSQIGISRLSFTHRIL